MNRDRIEGSLKQLYGKAREAWSACLGDTAGANAARLDQRAGSIQERHGIARQEAERQLRDFLDRNRDWNLSRH